ncbi:phytanoyl-CoA dioxygenase [Rhodoferax lacus]|uniref:Phytanoyl-CoA dioxygenase n=1 Tax=Rhodoferax lacus TaxID=2184758 RepID=A0A3E1R7P3_9BURK|nr:phytanoyl-CoA dioxygenase family protein [Rhodoferax lacus]RFO95263.1 phytanoyl-CoA dioxygenase [Rhodoferax lacus]
MVPTAAPSLATTSAAAPASGYLQAAQCQVSDLDALRQTATQATDCPQATHILQGVPVYEARALRVGQGRAADPAAWRNALMAEWARVWQSGPGVLVVQGLYPDVGVVDATTHTFQTLIEESRKAGHAGDHFAKPGANDRVWNALEKLCLRAPDVFAAYYGNALLATVCEAWLGPAYQITSQINCVNPGGQAQVAHRDYHLGFFNAAGAERFPTHVHRLSPLLTLQGAVAHVDMPLESGPTLYLPHSQKYLPGYLVSGVPAFQAYFDSHHVQLPLAKGDGIFFNPALMHAAGTNRSSHIRRMANLLQISSAFGRCMESVDRVRMAQQLYPSLCVAQGTMDPANVAAAIAACAEGYAFPTNLDRDPPLGGLAPQSQQDLMRSALAQGISAADFNATLQAQAQTRLS